MSKELTNEKWARLSVEERKEWMRKLNRYWGQEFIDSCSVSDWDKLPNHARTSIVIQAC